MLILFAVEHQALALFLGHDSAAVAIGTHIGRIATWGFIAFGVTMVLFGVVRANGQVVWPLLILFISLYPIRLGVAVGLGGWLGADALWISFPVAMMATLTMASLLYLQGGWRRETDMNINPDPEGIAPETQTVTAEAAPIQPKA